MENQKFEVKGTFRMGEDWMPYTKVIEAPNEKQAQEQPSLLSAASIT
jgi:large subunit ribosomal protein LX